MGADGFETCFQGVMEGFDFILTEVESLNGVHLRTFSHLRHINNTGPPL